MKELLSKARWIWPVERFHQLRNVHACFRRDFELAARPDSAPFAVTADQRYQLWVNGQYVGRGPARGYQASWPYDAYDLAPFLRAGKNWISIRAYNGGVGTFQYRHDAWAGMLCAGQIGEIDLASGAEWRCRRSPAYRGEIAKLSWQLDFQEEFDARAESSDWLYEEDAVLADWRQDGGLPYGHQPWHAVEERGIPLLTSRLAEYSRAVSQGSGSLDEDWKAPWNLFHPIWRELKAGQFSLSAPGALAGEAALPATGPGRWASISLDLGRPGFGHLELEAEGPEGAVLDLLFTEALNADGSPTVGRNLTDACEASLAARIILRPGTTRHALFHAIGHRAVTAIARGTDAEVRLRLRLRETIYPLEVQGSFACDNPVISDIHRISVQTQRVCMLDAYVDTPWREQAQWWGDARVQAQNTFFLAADARLLARGIRSIAGQTLPNGLTYGHAPTTAHNCVLPDFTLTWLLTIYDYWFQTGDSELIAELLPKIENALTYFESEGMGPHGLPRFDPRYWLFLDWTDIYRGGEPGLLAMLYILAVKKLAIVAEEAGQVGLAGWCRRIGARTTERVERLLWNDQLGLFCDGLTEAGSQVPRCSVQMQALAILAGLRVERHKHLVEERLIPVVQGRQIDSAEPSSFWVSFVLDALEQAGRTESIVDYIHTRWSPMLPYEGTWEGFVPADESALAGAKGSGSMTHAWSAHPIYHLGRVLGGIRQKEPAWREVWFEPRVSEASVSRVECVVPTPHGLIRSKWERKDGSAKVRLELPAGVAAEVVLAEVRERVSGSAEWTVPAG